MEDNSTFELKIADIMVERVMGNGSKHFHYHMRHSDFDWATPITIERGVLINHCATLITENEIPFGPSGVIELTEEQQDFILDYLSGGTDGSILILNNEQLQTGVK